MTILATAILAAGLGRSISIAPRSQSTWVVLQLPQQIDSGPDQQYDDLRVVDDLGKETPYVLDPQCSTIQPRNAALSDIGFVRGSYTEALLDAGTSGSPYSAVSIETPRGTFFTRVAVAISDDRRTWREVNDNGLIYRVADSSDPGSQTVEIPSARARWVRVRIMDRTAIFPITSATLANEQDVALKPEQLLNGRRVSAVAEKHSNAITFDLGTPNTTVSRVHFETSRREFSRSVTILESDDGTDWRYAGEGTIERFMNGAPALDVSVAPQAARFVRVIIENGDDPPLPDLRFAAFGPSRFLVFVAQPGRSYILANVPSNAPPHYDLTTLLAHDNPRRLERAGLAGAVTVQRASPTRIATQPWIVTMAFAVAIITLGAITVATLRRSR